MPPAVVLRQVLEWLPLADVARAALASSRGALGLAARSEVARDAAARAALRAELGAALDLPPTEARATCGLPGLRPFAELLSLVRRAPPLDLRCAAVPPGDVLEWTFSTGELAASAARSGTARTFGAPTTTIADASAAEREGRALPFASVMTWRYRDGVWIPNPDPEAAELVALLRANAVVRLRWDDRPGDVEAICVAAATRQCLDVRSVCCDSWGMLSVRWRLVPLGVAVDGLRAAGSLSVEANSELYVNPLAAAPAGPDDPSRSGPLPHADTLRRMYDRAPSDPVPDAFYAHLRATGLPIARLQATYSRPCGR